MGTKSLPVISLITATWNSVDTIEDCLDAVKRQSYERIEHVVVDGASQDGTTEILMHRRAQLGVFRSEPDKGIYDALNKGINLSSGEVIGFLHADDVFADDDVLRAVADAFADPSVAAVYGDLEYVRKDDLNEAVRFWRSCPFEGKLLGRGWMPPHPTLYVRRQWYERIGGFDTRYRIAADYFSILKLFTLPGFFPVYIPRTMVKMRLGGASNRSLKNILRKSREDLDALRRSGVGGFRALALKNVSKLGQFFC